jgi:glycine/D-amino acid oxidase-like deaminating enzyme/nitrite reductase/ring-hydroxylating ferredoxin subunit
MTTSSTPPLWNDSPRPAYADHLPASGQVEALVVGGGLTGLTTALLLARAGVAVAVVDARGVGSGTTGASTAKVSLVQGTKLSRIGARHPLGVVQAYADANREGQAWLREFCEEHDVPFASRPAGTYAATRGEVDAVRAEHDALRSVGLPVRWSDALDVPFEVHGAAVLDDQVQLDPMDVVHALAAQVRTHGGTLHEHQRVRSVEHGDQVVAHFASGAALSADRLVIATGAPALSGWLWPGAKTSANRSYLIALEGADPVPGMFISAGRPTRSVRTAAPRTGADVTLVGGSGHPVGRTRSEAGQLDDLRTWAATHFPGSVVTHAWSAQDYALPDELPTYGPVGGTDGRVHLATGYDKWGMTNAVAAARAISADILGKPASWSEDLRRRPVSPRSVLGLARQGMVSGAVQVRSLLTAEVTALPHDQPSGTGRVGRSGIRPTAVSRVDGESCAVSAICTHLGGVLAWNDQEQSWDCPLHGSRFGSDGAVLEGPASAPLARVDASGHQPAGSGRPSA